MNVVIPLLLLGVASACSSSSSAPDTTPRLVGGPCEGCEAILEWGRAPLAAAATLPGFRQGTGRPIRVQGTIYQPDGKTPAPGVVLYVYHTDHTGHYTPARGATGWARRHGATRGWVKTGVDGRYAFITRQPGVYPDRSAPAHIHPTVLEPNGKYYWLDSYHFAGDPLLTEKERTPAAPRGGSSGLLTLRREGAVWVGTRDITLGKHVSPYE